MKAGIIVAMETEYEALRRSGTGCVELSGIGKVNAAMTATEMILRDRPDCIINSGCAGGMDPSLNIADFVVGTQTAFHDVWCGVDGTFGQVQGCPARFSADPGLLAAAESLGPGSRCHFGLICSGDQFFISLEEDARIRRLYPDALACDMESAAIAQVCSHFKVPFLSFRIISDIHTDTKVQKETYEGFWKDISNDSFSFVRQLIERI